jgi:hydrogenase maturation factor HypE
MASKYRDVDIVTLPNKDILVIACDSCGGIGLKDQDVVKAPPFIVGKYTARVCLMEVFAVGAMPAAMTVNICKCFGVSKMS